MTRLRIEGFRGINNEADPLDLTFAADSVNSVFALNGIGKSSIFEALSFAIQGDVPKLESLQADEKPQDYYCNRFHSKGLALIELEFEPDDGGNVVSIRVERNAAGKRTISSPSGHADPERFLASLREPFALLDYRSFMKFIEDSPLRRGRTFSALLGLSAYSDRRQALQAISNTRALNTDLEMKVLATAIQASQRAAQQQLSALRSSYLNITGNALQDVGQLDECAQQVVAALAGVELLQPLVTGKSLDKIDFTTVKTVIRDAEGGEKRRDLEAALVLISELEPLTAYDHEIIATEQEQIKVLIAERDARIADTRGDLFKRLYVAAGEVVESTDWLDDQQCPLCESALNYSISGHIAEQLEQYSATALKVAAIDEVWKGSAWRACLAALEGARQLKLNSTDARVASLDAKFGAGSIATGDVVSAVAWTTELAAKPHTLLAEAQTLKATLEGEVPPSLVQLTEQVEYGRQFKDALLFYAKYQEEEAQQQRKLELRERWKTFIQQATTIFGDAEAVLSKRKIAAIGDDYKSMFKAIMQVGDVVPELQRADGKEDLHVQLSEFHGQHKLSARALLSESYRNALAISVFLAAAAKHTGAPRFIVLDDVTSSFDAGHQYYLMEYIRNHLQQEGGASGLQFIILSHDGLLEKYFDRLDSEAKWRHNKLQGSPPMGAILNQAQGTDRLKATIGRLLAAGQMTEAGPLIRQYLEYKLLQIIRKTNIPVPIDFAIKDTTRMAQNCIDAITSCVKLHQKAGTLILDSTQLNALEAVHLPAIVGNFLSHYETGSGTPFSAAVLSAIMVSIDSLTECFKYDDTSGGNNARKWYRTLASR